MYETLFLPQDFAPAVNYYIAVRQDINFVRY